MFVLTIQRAASASSIGKTTGLSIVLYQIRAWYCQVLCRGFIQGTRTTEGLLREALEM